MKIGGSRQRAVDSVADMPDHPLPDAVALRDRASGRFLASGGVWTTDESEALRLDEREAADVLRRFACEPHALDLVRLEDSTLAVA